MRMTEVMALSHASAIIDFCTKEIGAVFTLQSLYLAQFQKATSAPLLGGLPSDANISSTKSTLKQPPPGPSSQPKMHVIVDKRKIVKKFVARRKGWNCR